MLHVIVTRPAAQAAPWVLRLRELGVAADALPLIDIAALADTAPLRSAWASLAAHDLVMFVSANAVSHFFAARPQGAVWPASTLAASTGPGTSAALREAGVGDRLIEPPAHAPYFDSEALWGELQRRAFAGRRALVVRGEDGRDWLAQTLRGAGVEVGFVAAYRRLPPVPDAAGRALLAAAQAAPAAYLWAFSSSEAVAALAALAPGAAWSAAHAVASHPRIAEAARGAGFGRVTLRPPEPAAVAALAAAGGGPSIESDA